MKRLPLIIAWIVVVVTAVFLRFDNLGERPFHADEATGARITAHRMESTGGEFNPKHYHGPLLADLAIPLCRLRGEQGWADLSKYSLRLIPAVAGALLVFLPLLWRRWGGDLMPLLAAALLATSPLLVYYSRMFIHESLLVLFGMATLGLVVRFPRYGLPGLGLGLMFAVKETFAISVIAWSGAAALVLWERRGSVNRDSVMKFLREWWCPFAVSGLVALLVSVIFYTHGFTHLRGAVDALKTFFVYETVEGHDKAVGYYMQLLLWPQKAAGFWWYGTPVAMLALLAYLDSFRRNEDLRQKSVVRFLAYATLGHFVVYSAFAYKTPWLACLPWAHVCVLAGFSIYSLRQRSRAFLVAVLAVVVIALISQFRQTRLVTGRLNSDARNPVAYVPTRKDVERLFEWLEQLQTVSADQRIDRVAVVGSDYWPLPWYLRTYEKVGYWPQSPDGIAEFPLIFAMPEAAETVMRQTSATHVFLPRGLRADVPLQLFLSKDLWNAWMNADTP